MNRGLSSRSSVNRALVLVAFACALACAGCPPAGETKPTPPTGAACARIGQSCEFAPGKLGTCVQRDDCTATDCFVCQSQH